MIPAVLPGYGAPLRAVCVSITIQEGGEEGEVYRSLSNAHRSLSNVPRVYTATVEFIDARSAPTARPQEPKDKVVAALIQCITQLGHGNVRVLSGLGNGLDVVSEPFSITHQGDLPSVRVPFAVEGGARNHAITLVENFSMAFSMTMKEDYLRFLHLGEDQEARSPEQRLETARTLLVAASID